MDSQCQVHVTHRPKPLRWVSHHIQPLGMGGADVPENQIKTCDTGHYNIHRLLGILETRDKQVPVTGPGQKKFDKADPGTSTEQALAMQGFEAWIAAGRPGSRVYEDHAQEPHRWGWE